MRKRIIQICVVLFIGINFLFVYFDKEGKVERKSYIKGWSEVFTADMKEQLFTPGVLSSTGEEYVYFDKSLGQFQEFLTEEGTYVKLGDPLFSYKVDSFYESEIRLSNEVQKLKGEISAIESAVSQMKNHKISSSSTKGSPSVEINEEEIKIDFDLPNDTTEAEMIKEQYIVEKEKELGQKQSELTSTESQLKELQSSGDTITVDSPYEGRITTLKTTLDDPIITIEKAELHAKGVFTENERTTAKQDLPVDVMIKERKVALQGVIGKISESPEEINLEGESVYPFDVEFEETELEKLEELFPGYHADLAITMKDSPNATALFEDVLSGGSVWKMTAEGKLVHQAIKRGIYMDGMYEITKGVEKGEWIAEEQKSQFRPNANFITPIKMKEVPWKKLSKHKNKGRNIFIGILSR